MDPDVRPQKSQDNLIPSLNLAIRALSLTEKVSSIAPVRVAFDTVAGLLTMIKVRFLFGYYEIGPQVHQ